MKRFYSILEKCPLFYGIEKESLLRMLTCLGATVDFYDKKYTVMPEGRPVKHIGIVLSGSVQMSLTDYYGNRSIISKVYPGELFAEAFACTETETMPLSVTANEPSYIMLIDCSHILHTCTNNCDFHQQLIFNLMKDIAAKALFFQQRIEITSKRSTREKLMTYLNITAKETGHSSFEIPFDRQELADFLEVERSGLSAEISKLRKEGIIESKKKYFKLL